MTYKKFARVVVVVALLLLVPLVVPLLGAEMNWNLFDFVVAGALLLSAGLLYEFLASRAGTMAGRGATALTVGTALLLIWVNLAVGLIGSEDNPANVLYFGVIAVLFLGTIMAYGSWRKMARVLFVTALAQALVPLIAMIIWQPSLNFGVVQVLGVNAFFVVLWVGAALLFLRTNTSPSGSASAVL